MSSSVSLDPRFLLAYLGRGLQIWLGARLVLAAVMYFGLGAVHTSARMAILMIGFVAFLDLLDLRRRGDVTLLGNLGVAQPVILLILLCPAVLGEFLLNGVLWAR